MATTDMEIEKARKILNVLLSLGRPDCPAEIASRCLVFSDESRDLVEFLCRIPNSPLLLTDGAFGTVPEVAVASFVEIMSRTIAQFLPHIMIRVRGSKRKRMGPLLLPAAKRMLLLRSGDEEMEADEDAQATLSLVNRTDNAFAAEDLPSAGASRDNQEISSLHDEAVFNVGEFPTCCEEIRRNFVEEQTMDDLSAVGFPAFSEALNTNKDNRSTKKDNEVERDWSCILPKKIKSKRNLKLPIRENRAHASSKAVKNPLESKKLPDLESFIIEEEEGSGGYGTVYRVHRKTDGKTFAVKCPHPSANLHHVSNELKMLERYGGRNFVIKFEGSFRRGNSDCLVMEHVVHDRPEVLKREIDVFELRWYGYCMFKALTGLHKQGIVHRDVKPGNFLFSQKLNKGYLIDFNLAMNLHHKYHSNSKSGAISNGITNDTSPQTKPTYHIPVRKVASNRHAESVRRVAAKDSKMHHSPKVVSKNIKKKVEKNQCNVLLDFESRSKYRSQAADGSGITSTKDLTSTRTPSGDRLKEPIPFRGRKELINLVQEVMQSPNLKAVTIPAIPAIQRKRVAAPTEGDMRQAVVTPMPLHHKGIAISGAGPLRNKENGKYKREGPCVGTKGFRAPEVLFKSCHQGFKVDVWSAGVTLLYLMIGKTPFGGDPEQNVKEIAKLRGSEDLWEVAKLHNRESSFPVELFDISYLHSLKLRDWCVKNTKRPDFLAVIPNSLFDLVDKCLTVNPRSRISAEEALIHEFFAPCHESLRKHRLQRQALASSSES